MQAALDGVAFQHGIHQHIHCRLDGIHRDERLVQQLFHAVDGRAHRLQLCGRVLIGHTGLGQQFVRLIVDALHLVDGVFLAFSAVHCLLDGLERFLDEGIACSGGSLCHGLLGLFDQFVKGFQQLIGAVLADDVFQLLVQIVAELVQSGDLFQRGHVLIVDDLVDLVGHIRDQLGQFFVQDGVPQLFQGAGNIELLDHVLVLFDHILELVQLFLISTVFQRLFQLVLDAVDIGLFDLFQCFAELIRHIRSIGAQFINGFLRLIERLVDLGQIAVLDGFLQGVQGLVGGSFLQGFFCVLDDRVHSVLQDGVFLDLVDQIPGLLDQFLQLLDGILTDVAVLDLFLQLFDQCAGVIYQVDGLDGSIHCIHDLLIAFLQAVRDKGFQIFQHLFERFQLGFIQLAVLQLVPDIFNDLLGILSFDLFHGLFQRGEPCFQLGLACIAVVQLIHGSFRCRVGYDHIGHVLVGHIGRVFAVDQVFRPLDCFLGSCQCKALFGFVLNSVIAGLHIIQTLLVRVHIHADFIHQGNSSLCRVVKGNDVGQFTVRHLRRVFVQCFIQFVQLFLCNIDPLGLFMADITGGFIIQRLTQKFLINRPLRKFVGHQSSAGHPCIRLTAARAVSRCSLLLAGGISVIYIILVVMTQSCKYLNCIFSPADLANLVNFTVRRTGRFASLLFAPLVLNISVRDGAGLYAAVFLATTSGAGQGLYAVFRAGRFFRLYPVPGHSHPGTCGQQPFRFQQRSGCSHHVHRSAEHQK